MKFNFLHSRTRMSVERANGLLKMKMKVLYNGIRSKSIKTMVKIIGAGCVLHNITLHRAREFVLQSTNDVFITCSNERWMQNITGRNVQDEAVPSDGRAERKGQAFRNALCSQVQVTDGEVLQDDHDYWFRYLAN